VLVLDERYQVHEVLALDNEGPLAGVPVGVRLLQDVEQVAALNVKDDVLDLGNRRIRPLCHLTAGVKRT